MLRRGDLPDLDWLGDKMLAALARRDGVTPLEEWSEFMDAFRSKVGVADRDEGATEADELRRGLRMALPGRGELGELRLRLRLTLSTTGLSGLSGFGAAGRGERGVLAGEDAAGVVMARRFKDCARSPAPPGTSLL